MKNNALTSTTLTIGQILKIPTQQTEIDIQESCYGEAESIEEQPLPIEYTVQKGDTLYSIAKKFNTTVLDILEKNNLATTVLSIGNILLIPNVNQLTTTFTYIVQKGDTLYSIAKKYNTTTDQIKNINNLTSNMLSVGQQLIIERTI